MTQTGWAFSEPEDQDVCVFSREHEEGEQQLWLWKSTSHPKFRSRVQNIIFSLAVQSKREPIEIANEIYDSKVVEPESEPADSKPTGEFQIDIVNSQDVEWSVTTSAHPAGEFKLKPGQGFCLRIDNPNGRPKVEYGKESIAVSSSVSHSFRIFSCQPAGQPTMRLMASPEWTEFLTKPSSDQSVENCAGFWERAQFDLSDLQPQPGYEKSVLKTVAVLVVAVAQEDQSDDAEFTERLWNMTVEILGLFGLQMEFFPDGQQEFMQTAKFDRSAFPSNLLDWLGIHTLLASNP